MTATVGEWARAIARGALWALVWLACGVLGWVLLRVGLVVGLLPLLVFALAGIDGAARAFGLDDKFARWLRW